VAVGRVGMADPGDVSQLVRWWEEAGRPRVRAVLGKTEGNGCVNDFSRGLATLAIKKSPIGAACPDLCAVMSGGTEGVLTPHFLVFAEDDDDDDDDGAEEDQGERLSLGVSRTRAFAAEEIGTRAQAEETRAAVLEACAEAKLAPSELLFAQIKCPLLTSERMNPKCVTHDTYESMALSRAASALGVGLATGEISENFAPSSSSSVASTSAGVELLHSEVLVLGNGAARGRFRAANGVMRDAADLPAVVACLEDDLGLVLDRGALAKPDQVTAVLCKADPSPELRGHRTTMLTDSDFNATRHSRAAVGGLLAGVFGGESRLFVSGGAERQGPPGGGPFLVIQDMAV